MAEQNYELETQDESYNAAVDFCLDLKQRLLKENKG